MGTQHLPKVDVVLLAPPYYRFCGSHNNRPSPTLTYLSAYLEDEGIAHVLYNADHTPATRYWSMRWMFEHYDSFVDAVNGKGSLYGEVVETVMSMNPKAVCILAGETLIATKDWANPWIAVNYAAMFKKLGVRTIGIGHFLTLDRARFEGSFDGVLGGEPSPRIVDLVTGRLSGYVSPSPIPLDRAPSLAHLYPSQQETDMVMTSFGCRFPCEFCLVQQLYAELDQGVRFVDVDVVMADLAQREETDIYLTDLTFTYARHERLTTLAQAMSERGIRKRYTIDTRADMITPTIADLLSELGVKRVKIGVEGITEDLLNSFNKRTSLAKIEKGIDILRERDIEVVTYLLIGGVTSVRDYELTREYIKRLKPEFVPVAIWAYDLSTDYRYDTQFSPLRLAEWGIDEDVFFQYLALQDDVNPTVGTLLDYS